jgi:hypothetical protein
MELIPSLVEAVIRGGATGRLSGSEVFEEKIIVFYEIVVFYTNTTITRKELHDLPIRTSSANSR